MSKKNSYKPTPAYPKEEILKARVTGPDPHDFAASTPLLKNESHPELRAVNEKLQDQANAYLNENARLEEQMARLHGRLKQMPDEYHQAKASYAPERPGGKLNAALRDYEEIYREMVHQMNMLEMVLQSIIGPVPETVVHRVSTVEGTISCLAEQFQTSNDEAAIQVERLAHYVNLLQEAI